MVPEATASIGSTCQPRFLRLAAAARTLGCSMEDTITRPRLIADHSKQRKVIGLGSATGEDESIGVGRGRLPLPASARCAHARLLAAVAYDVPRCAGCRR